MASVDRNDGWGPIRLEDWRETPCVQGRVATEDDVKAGKAVFYLDLSQGQQSHAIALNLPRCAVLNDENGTAMSVIVIQAEESNNGSGSVKVFAGYRPLTGGNGICMLDDLQLLEEPDHRFASPAEL